MLLLCAVCPQRVDDTLQWCVGGGLWGGGVDSSSVVSQTYCGEIMSMSIGRMRRGSHTLQWPSIKGGG
jgi:hypothetical protein